MDKSNSLQKEQASNNEVLNESAENNEYDKVGYSSNTARCNLEDKNHADNSIIQKDNTMEDMFETGIQGPQPPDGGLHAWVVMIASFLCNGIIFGTINSAGVIFHDLKRLLKESGEENPASQASITLSLAIGMTFFLSMISGILTDKLGIRMTTIIGGGIATLGMFLSSMYFMQVKILALTMGVVFGTGASLAYTPSLVILGHYFLRRLGIVNGIVTAGSSVFTIIMTQLLNVFITKFGLKASFQLLAGLMSILMICGLTFKPILPNIPRVIQNKEDGKFCTKVKLFIGQLINFEIWKNKHYVIWALCIPLALFGYFVPYIHLISYAKDVLGTDVKTEVLVQCIGLSSGFGRIFFGLIADKPWVNRIVLQQISFFSIGTLTILLTLANALWMFIVISLLMGVFDGCFISLLGPIAFDIVGPSGASQAIGCLLALCSIPLTFGPYFAGIMYDYYGNYTIPFICAGIPPIVGGVALFLVRCVKKELKYNVADSSDNKKGPKNNIELKKGPNQPEGVPLMNGSNSMSKLEDCIQVDVKRLVALERESCV